MANLVYSVIASLDGYVADADGSFEWAAPDEELHAFVNDLERTIGTHLYGRRMYEVMAVWETMAGLDDGEPVTEDYGNIWRAADKVVYSTSLASVSSARTSIERSFDPGALTAMKNKSGHDISVGGPGLAGQAIAAGAVDEYHLFVTPVLVGGGTVAWPDARVRRPLRLVGQDRFESGVVHLHYRE